MTRIRSRRRSEAHLIAGLDGILGPRPRFGVLGAGWRWRYELMLGTAIATTLLMLVRTLGAEWTVIWLSALAGAVVPPGRNR